MKGVLWLCSYLFLSACFVKNQQLSAEDQPSFAFEIHDHMLIVNGQVNGKSGKFIIDTGAGVSLLDLNQAKKYEFNYFKDNSNDRLTGFGGRSQLLETSTVFFQLKGAFDRPIKFYTSDLNGLNSTLSHKTPYIQILGALGADFLDRYKAVIDYRKRNNSLFCFLDFKIIPH